MSKIDESKLRNMLAARRRYSNLGQEDFSRSWERRTNRRASEVLLKSFLAKAGLDADVLNQLMADNKHEQHEMRRFMDKQKAEAAKYLPSRYDTYRRGIDNRKNALGYLATIPAPFVSWFATLDKPFIIYEYPHFKYLGETHIESMNSWLKFYIDSSSAFINSDSTEFIFFFVWTNESPYAAVVNVSSSVALSGYCEESTVGGFFSGNSSFLDISAELTLWEWWEDPPQQILAGNPSQVLDIDVQGGGIFGQHGKSEKQNFDLNSYDFSYNNMFFIPGSSTAVFQVSLNVRYTVDDSSSDGNVTADFSTDPNYFVLCPSVQLEVLTPPPGASALAPSTPS